MKRTAVALLLALAGLAGPSITSAADAWPNSGPANRAQRDTERVAAMQQARDALAAELGVAQQERSAGQRANERLRAGIAEANNAVEAARAELAAATADLDDLMAAARQFAGDLHALRQRERIVAANAERDGALSAIASAKRPLTSAELRDTWQFLLRELEAATGSRRLEALPGSDEALLKVGAFAAYNADGFYALNAPDPVRLAAPGAPLPPADATGLVAALIDPSRGASPALLAQRGSAAAYWQRILGASGGIGITIAALGALGFSIVLVQLPALMTARRRMQRIVAGQPGKANPLARLMQAAEKSSDGSALERSLRREVARLERGQPLVGLLVAMAPLLGLLGTVTGLIVTFQTLGLYGGSDPSLMAGGISRALTTTALGLAVAVPLALALALLRSLSAACVRMLETFAASHVDAT